VFENGFIQCHIPRAARRRGNEESPEGHEHIVLKKIIPSLSVRE
jgi:hypothetical protein